MEKYEIPDTGIRSFRLRNKICEAKIHCEDKLTIYNLHPEDKWTLCEFKAFIYKALKDFNYDDNCIDKYLQSVNDKISILDLSSSKDDILLRYGNENVQYVFNMDEHGYFKFDRVPWNFKEFNIKDIVSIMDYLTREYELEDLQSEVIPIPKEICNIVSLDQLTVKETKSKECTNTSKVNLIEVEPETTLYPMVHINIKTFNSIKDVFYKETGIILDDFMLMEVDQLTRCSAEKYEIQEAIIVANNNRKYLIEQFFKDLCNDNRVMLMTNPETFEDTLDIIINVTLISSVRYCFKLK